MKRNRSSLTAFAAIMLCAAATAFAQTQDNSPSAPAAKPAAAGVTKTVVGCLTGYEGRYTIGTSSDQLYLLEGDSAMFKRFNAVLVRATGTVTESAPGPSRHDALSQQPPTMVVAKLKKLADGCN